MLPIEAHTGRLQTGDAKVDAVAGSGEASGEVELNVGGSSGPGDSGAEDFESNFRLAQSCPNTGL